MQRYWTECIDRLVTIIHESYTVYALLTLFKLEGSTATVSMAMSSYEYVVGLV